MNYIKIDKTIKKALYLQIKDSIEEAIKSGELTDNDRLPTESELCEVFKISDIVVKNAYKMLVKQGLIIRVQGSGTFVSTRKVFKFPLAGFDRLSSFSGYNYQSKFKKVILFDISSEDPMVISTLQLPEKTSYFVIKYIVFIEHAEVLMQTLYLSQMKFPDLKIHDIEHHNLVELLSQRFPYGFNRVKSGFSPVNLSSSEALLLNTYKHAAAHRVRTVVHTKDDDPIAFIETLFLGQYTQFEVILG